MTLLDVILLLLAICAVYPIWYRREDRSQDERPD